MERKTSRKLSSDLHRKLSQISTCSDISNLSFKLGMEPDDFKSTIKNILDLDVGDAWVIDSDDDLSCYGDDVSPTYARKSSSEVVTLSVNRKASTESTVSTDSLNSAEDFVPVQVDVDTVKQVLQMYQKHRKNSSKMAPILAATSE